MTFLFSGSMLVKKSSRIWFHLQFAYCMGSSRFKESRGPLNKGGKNRFAYAHTIFHAILRDDCEVYPDTPRPKGENVLS